MDVEKEYPLDGVPYNCPVKAVVAIMNEYEMGFMKAMSILEPNCVGPKDPTYCRKREILAIVTKT